MTGPMNSTKLITIKATDPKMPSKVPVFPVTVLLVESRSKRVKKLSPTNI